MNRYTQEDDAIIIEEIGKSPANIKNAFKNASARIGRSVSSINGRYYMKIKSNVPVLAMASHSGVVTVNEKVKQVSSAKLAFTKELVDKLPLHQRKEVALHIFNQL